MIYLKQSNSTNSLEALISEPLLDAPSYNQFVRALEKFKIQEDIWELTINEDIKNLSQEDIKWDREESKIIYLGLFYPFGLGSQKRPGIIKLKEAAGFPQVIINPELSEYRKLRGNLWSEFNDIIEISMSRLNDIHDPRSQYITEHLDHLYTQFLKYYIIFHPISLISV